MKTNAERKISFILIILLLIGSVLWAGGEKEAEEPAVSDIAEPQTEAEIYTEGYKNPIITEETEDSITVLDFDGKEVTLSKRPERVIVNYTSMLGLWYMAGGEAIGRPDTRSGRGVPEAAMDIETTGHTASPNTEKIVSLQPDLVILSGTTESHRNVKEVLDQNGIENIFLGYENYHDFVNTLDLFARLIDNTEVIEDSVPAIEKAVQGVIAEYKNQEAFSFLSLFGSTRGVSAELNVAHTAHMAAMLGGENIAEERAPDRGQKRITLSMERIVQRDPDVILVTVMGDLGKVQDKMKEDLMSNQAWAALTAVQNDRIYYLPGEFFLYKPNERFPEAFEFLGDIVFNQ